MTSTSGCSPSKASATEEEEEEEDELKDRYEKFLVDFRKGHRYTPEEKEKRFEIFKKRVRDIERHNLTCHPWEKQGINSTADVDLKGYGGFFMGTPPSTSSVSIWPTQLKGHGGLSDCVRRTYKETEYTVFPKEVFDLLDACVKFQEDSARKNDEKNQVVTQQDSAPKDEENLASFTEDELKDRYEKFLVDFRKGHRYTPEEKQKRFEIFKKRVRDIERHNLTCHPWEKLGINSTADVELKGYGGFFMGTPPSTSSVSILPTQLKGHGGLSDCVGRTYKETEYTVFPKEVFDLLDACVKFQEDSARKDDEKNQVVTQQDSAPKDEENLGFTEDELKDRYEKFLVDFRKGHCYTPEEKQKRFEIFKKTVRDVERHNLTCHPWEKQGINSSADVELKGYGGFFMGTPPSTSSVSILPTQLKGHGGLLDFVGRTYKETKHTKYPKEVFDLLDACVKFQKDSAHKDDEKNQVVTQQDSAPKDEENLASFTEDELKDRYEKFLVDFRKGHCYTPEEKQKRFEIFKKTVREVERHNLTCHPWEKQGINSSADMELKGYGGFFMGTPPSTSSVSILPTQLKGHGGLLDFVGTTYKETKNTTFPKEVFDLLDACVKFQKDSAHKDDEKNQVVTQQDSAPKDEETQEVLDEQERANAGLKRRKELDEKESLIDRKKQKLDVEEGKNGMQSSFLHMASTERKTAYDDTLRLLEEPNKLEMEIEGLKGKMVNSTLEEQIKKINDELETKIKREKEEALRKVRQLVAEQQLEQSKGTMKVMKHVDNEDDPELQEQDKKDE